MANALQRILGFELNRCHLCGAQLAPDDFDAICTTCDKEDELEILEALIESNRQRVKENEQIGREADAILGIEKARAQRRQQATQLAGKDHEGKPKKVSVRESIPEPKKARARDSVGKKVGVSGKTAERSAFCVRVMDALSKIGKTVEAQHVRQMLRKNEVGFKWTSCPLDFSFALFLSPPCFVWGCRAS